MIVSVIKERPWAILLIWIIVAALASPLAAKLNDVVETETTSFLPENVESIQASKMLAILQDNTTTTMAAEPAYMILVHNVPVSLDTYYKLKNEYHQFDTMGFQVFSWIDIVSMAEENMTNGFTEGLNSTLQAVASTVQINVAYNKTVYALNMTAYAVAGIDQAYTSTLQGLYQLESTVPQLRNAQQALVLSCNQILPALTNTYYNVVRAEALLENLTDAYQTGNLTQEDIAIVVSASNLTDQGIPPLDPQLVSLVYAYTLQNGGPGGFTNTLAANIAGNIAWQYLQSMIPPEQINQTQLLFNLTQELLTETLSLQQDHRQIVTSSTDLASGQLQLFQAIALVEEQAKPQLLQAIINLMADQAPPEAVQLINLTLTYTYQLGCSNETLEQALLEALEDYIAGLGIPGDPSQLAQSIITDTVNASMVLDFIIETAIQEMGTTGENMSELIPFLKQVIETLDPNATGLLVDMGQALKAASTVILASQGLPLEEALQIASEAAPTLESQAYIIVNQTVWMMAGDKGVYMLAALYDSNLLGVSNETLLENLPQVLATSLSSEANMSIEQAAQMISLAVKVYTGETGFEEAVSQMVNATLPIVFQEIIDQMKGLLIETDGNGFIIAVQPPQQDNNIEDTAPLVEQLKDELKEVLAKAGFSSATLLLGGNDYMVYEMRHAAQQDIERSDRLSMVFVIIVLALLLESLAAIFLPFIGIGMGLIFGMAIAYLLASQGVIDITTHSRTIMFTTGLGLGIDYAVYVSKRFREAVAEGLHHREAAAQAFRVSWKPVLAGAATASIGFGSMILATDFAFISSIGATAPLTIMGVMLVSITFIPALLAYVGEKRWFWWPRKPQPQVQGKGKFRGIGQIIAGKPLFFIGIVIVATLAAALVMSGFQGSYDMALNLPRDSESAYSLDLLNTKYDPGILYPVLIVASDDQHASLINESLSQLQCVGRVEVLDGYQGRVVRAVMNVEPLSPEGIDCVREIRDVSHSVDPESLVGGMSSVNLDLSILINNVFYHKVYPVAIVLMFITLLLAYGGLASAITAVLSVVLAAYWGSALTVFVYENLLGQEVLWYLPVIVFTAILGVGMDYNSFYLARAREECERKCSVEGVVSSIEKGAPTVIGLATIMAGAYAGLVLTSSPGLSQMGLTLVVGVLLAGLNASLILTPPVIAYLKERAWWPRKPEARRA